MAASTTSSRRPVVGSHSSVSSILRRPFINAWTTLKLLYVFIVDDESLFHLRSALFPSAGLPAYAVSMKYGLYQAWWDSRPAPGALRVPVVGLQVKAVRSIGQVLQERRITHPMGARVGCSQPAVRWGWGRRWWCVGYGSWVSEYLALGILDEPSGALT